MMAWPWSNYRSTTPNLLHIYSHFKVAVPIKSSLEGSSKSNCLVSSYHSPFFNFRFSRTYSSIYECSVSICCGSRTQGSSITNT